MTHEEVIQQVEEKLADLAIKAGPVKSKVDEGLLEELRTQLGEENVRLDAQSRHAHGLDLGHQQAEPASVVVYPANVEQVVWVTKRPDRLKVYGAGSSLEGQVLAKGAISLDLSRLNKLLKLDKVLGVVRVQAGMRLKELNVQLGEDWCFPVDPCYDGTVGGLLVTDARGPSCVRWGGLHGYLQGVQMVIADGRLLHLDTQAPLLVGSHGRLGIVTEVEVRLIRKNAAGERGRLVFDSLMEAMSTASRLQHKLSSIQLLNPSMVRLLNKLCGSKWEEKITLLVEGHGIEMMPLEALSVRQICQQAWLAALQAGLKPLPVRSSLAKLGTVIPEMTAMAVTAERDDPALLSNLFDGLVFLFAGNEAGLGQTVGEDDDWLQNCLAKALDPAQKLAS